MRLGFAAALPPLGVALVLYVFLLLLSGFDQPRSSRRVAGITRILSANFAAWLTASQRRTQRDPNSVF